MTKHNVGTLSRRTFLASTAAGLATATCHGATPIRVGLIGLGATGTALFDLAAAPTTNLDVVAVADTDPGRLAILPASTTRSTAWESLIDDPTLDAVIVATPDCHHAAMTIAALDQGKHVYLLPPIGLTPQEIDQVQEAAERNPGRLYVAQDIVSATCWADGAKRCGAPDTLRWIQAGIAMGAPRESGHWSRFKRYGQGDGATALFTTLHPLLHHLKLGKPEQATLLGGVFETGTRDTPDALSFSATYAGGLRLTLTTTAHSTSLPAVIRGRQDSVEFTTPTGTREFDLANWSQQLSRGTHARHALDTAFVAQRVLCDALQGSGTDSREHGELKSMLRNVAGM